jgi:hypothetical protein
MEDDGFRDRHHRYSYLVACEIARRIVEDPTLVESGRRHLLRFSRPDPAQREAYALWERLIDQPVSLIAERLTERSARGDYTRETAPAFGHLPGPVRSRLLREARSSLPLPANSATVDS